MPTTSFKDVRQLQEKLEWFRGVIVADPGTLIGMGVLEGLVAAIAFLAAEVEALKATLSPPAEPPQ